MKILLVNPPETRESLGNLIYTIGIVWHPDWLAHMAAFLEQNNIDVRIFDFQINDFKNYKNLLKKHKFDYVSFSCHTSNYNLTLKLAKKTKRLSKAKIIFGGPHPSALPKEVAKEKTIDYVVVGNGEYALLEILNNKQKKKIVYCKKEVNVVPAYHLLEMDKYGQGTITSVRDPSFSVFSVKSCPYKCRFCHNKGKYIEQDLDLVFRKINILIKKYGMKDFKLMDGSFGMNKKRGIEFCKRLREYKLTWSCQARVEDLDKELIKEMSKSGCTSVGIGIESGSKKICKELKKEYRTNKIEHVLGLLKKYGIMARLCYMIGFPDETKEEVEKTLKLAKRLDTDFVHISIFTPFPGTAYYDELKRKKVKLSEDWNRYNTYNLVFKHRHLNEEYLKKSIKKTYREIYLSLGYFFGTIRTIVKDPKGIFKNSCKMIRNGIRFIKMLRSI